MLTSASVCFPGGRSESYPSGKVVEIDNKIARSLINGNLAEKTAEPIEQEEIPMAQKPTSEKIAELLKNKPVTIKRKPAVKKNVGRQKSSKKAESKK